MEELQATLCIAQKEYAKAREILEKKIYYTMNNQVMGCLLSLMDIAVREGKMEDAKRLADISSKGAEVFELWEYNRYSPYLQLAVVEQDKDCCFELLDKMFSLLGQDWKLADTLLYRDHRRKGRSRAGCVADRHHPQKHPRERGSRFPDGGRTV